MAHTKLSKNEIAQIHKRIEAGLGTLRSIATDFGVSYQTIYNIKRGAMAKDRLPGWEPKDEAEIEHYIRQEARRSRNTRRLREKSTACAAIFLSRHQSLYRRDNLSSLKQIHHEWMEKLIAWYEDEYAKSHKSKVKR